MNFLTMAANHLANKFADRFSPNADTAMGRMAQSFGLTHPNIDTPQGISDPDMFAKGLGKYGTIAPGIDPAEATRQQESLARQNGFHSYDQMMAWAKQRNNQTGGTIAGQSAPTGNPEGGPSTMGTQPMAMHPRNMFNMILDRWKNAMGGQ